MSYQTMVDVSRDYFLVLRITACAAAENAAPDPSRWVTDRMWEFAATPGWGDSWASALAAGANEDLGRDEAVITDGMILARVQHLIAKSPAE